MRLSTAVGVALAGIAATAVMGASEPAKAGTRTTATTAVSAAAGDAVAVAVGEQDGVAVLVPAREGSGWSTLTKLWVQGWDSSGWTAYDCLSGSGRYLAVTFAPSAFANDPGLTAKGAFGAVVDLQTGSRWVVPQRVALQYHTPSCGLGDLVAFSSYQGANETGARVIRVDAAHKRVIDVRDTPDQITSATPIGNSIVGVDGDRLVSLGLEGTTSTLSTIRGSLYDLRAAAEGGIDFLSTAGTSGAVAYERNSDGTLSKLGAGPLYDLGLYAGRGGHNRLAGATSATTAVDRIDGAANPLAVSLDGSLVVDSVSVPGITEETSRGDVKLAIRKRNPATNSTSTRDATATVGPSLSTVAASAATAKPAAPLTAAATAPTSPCAIAPLDPATQIVQPSPAQVQWAANRAVRGQLTFTRAANWQNHGLPAYVPQTVFPLPGLTGGGQIPVQVLEGILAQESNFSQASTHALPGAGGDPLISSYYGVTYDASGLISGMNFANADCGYGVGQITQHMTTADTTWSATTKREVATDYTVNIAAAVSILEQDWNQLKSYGLLANNGDPADIENWYFVMWAYNTGLHIPSGTAPWGLGWTNNPIQNAYPPNRHPFLSTYADASTPGNWPYQEKVMGWAQHPQQDLINGGYKYVGSQPLNLPTDYTTFCKSSNNCSPSSTSTGFCLSTDRTTCYWHSPVTFTATYVTENSSAYTAGAAEPSVANPYPPSCSAAASPVVQTPGTTALPSGSVIVDDLANSAQNVAGCAGATNPGSFALTYGTDSSSDPVGAIDTHQLGVGYMGHIYFTHTVNPTRTAETATGTWKPPTTVMGWQRIWVHIPNNGATTFQADYQIHTGTQTLHRIVNQRWNENSWFDLGSFQLSSGASVSLSNATSSDWNDGAVDIAWDALAFTPSSKPAVSYVALGDSYQSGEGVQPYYPSSDNGGSTSPHTDACHRSPQAYPNQVFNDLRAKHSGASEFHFIACSGATMSTLLGPSGQAHEENAQLLSGWLDANTTVVTVGIGGNDARFAAIIKGCLLTITACTSSSYKLTVNGVVDPQPLIQYEPTVINNLSSTLGSVYSQIHTLAPNAQIIVVGYPHVLDTGTRRSGLDCGAFDQSTVTWFAQMTDQLDSVIKTAATAAGATYVNTVPVFDGPPSHEACTPNTSDEWINAVVASSSSGSGSNTPGTGSFHPDASGHGADESAIKPVLK